MTSAPAWLTMLLMTTVCTYGVAKEERHYGDDILRSHLTPPETAIWQSLSTRHLQSTHSMFVMDCLGHVEVLSWPARFPNLSPIVHVCFSLYMNSDTVPICRILSASYNSCGLIWARRGQSGCTSFHTILPSTLHRCMYQDVPILSTLLWV